MAQGSGSFPWLDRLLHATPPVRKGAARGRHLVRPNLDLRLGTPLLRPAVNTTARLNLAACLHTRISRQSGVDSIWTASDRDLVAAQQTTPPIDPGRLIDPCDLQSPKSKSLSRKTPNYRQPRSSNTSLDGSCMNGIDEPSPELHFLVRRQTPFRSATRSITCA